jgi:hypothetical protein
MMKRKTGETACGKSQDAAAEEAELAAVSHNIRMLLENMRVII